MRFAQQSGTLFTFITKSIFVLLALHSEAIPPHTLASIPSITGTHHDYDNSDLSKKKKIRPPILPLYKAVVAKCKAVAAPYNEMERPVFLPIVVLKSVAIST